MNILIRVDASVELGTGHVMRCLTLAQGLRESGIQASFACQPLPKDLHELVCARGYAIHRLVPGTIDEITWDWEHDVAQTAAVLSGANRFDWLVVDRYGLDKKWESALRAAVRGIMVIDDLADRPHDCDVLLDQNYYRAFETRYDGLLPRDCLRLLGPRYALLRPEFANARRDLRRRDGSIGRVLIFLGGADSTNVTTKAIHAVTMTGRADIEVDVVIGATNPHRDAVEALCHARRNTRLHVQADNMAQLMAAADIAIGAGGATMWERCFLGLPTLTLVFAANQEQSTRDTSDIGAIRYLGWADKVSVDELARAISHAIDHPSENVEIGRRAMEMMNGFGLTERLPVVDALTARITRDTG